MSLRYLDYIQYTKDLRNPNIHINLSNGYKRTRYTFYTLIINTQVYYRNFTKVTASWLSGKE